MSKDIALVTDSTADLPLDFIKENKIEVIPLRVVFPDGEYRDGVDITPDEFYEKLKKSNELPKSSQPSPDDFVEVYQKLLQEYKEVISIHLSSKVSGTINAAQLAKKKVGGTIHIFDSLTVSLGIGMQIREALNCIQEGWSGDRVVDYLHWMRDNSATYFTVDSLKYLYLGGRISKAKSLMGSILNIKPILRLGPEGVEAAGKARSEPQLINGVIRKFKEVAGDRAPGGMAVAQGAAKEMGYKMKEGLEKSFNIKTSFFGQIGPTLGVHSGPGVVGVYMFFN